MNKIISTFVLALSLVSWNSVSALEYVSKTPLEAANFLAIE